MTINVWSDSMQHIELLGKPALFSDSRVDRSTVPDGWYVYDLRGSDYDPDLISTLEARVIVNYAGSILRRNQSSSPMVRITLMLRDKPIFLMRKSPL